MNGVSLSGVSNKVSPFPIPLSGCVICQFFFAAYLMVLFLDQNSLSLAHSLMSRISQNNSMVCSPFSAFGHPTESYAALNRVHVDAAKRMMDVLKDRCVKVLSGLIFLTYCLGSHTMSLTTQILRLFSK